MIVCPFAVMIFVHCFTSCVGLGIVFVDLGGVNTISQSNYQYSTLHFDHHVMVLLLDTEDIITVCRPVYLLILKNCSITFIYYESLGTSAFI